MSEIKKDNGRIDVQSLLLPAARNATATSAAVDLAPYQRAYIIIHAGAWTDGTHTPKIQTATTSGGSYADDSGLVGSQAFTAISSAPTASKTYRVDIDLGKVSARYLKLVLTIAGATTGAVTSAVLVGEKRVGS